jgi:hypothetical protein
MKDSRTLLLILVTVCLVGTWVFYVYDKVRQASLVQAVPASDSASSNKRLNDSLSRLYEASVLKIENTPVRDSISEELQQKMQEIDTLRQEIARMLSINTLTRDDLEKASRKIQELQRQVLALNQAPGTSTGEVQPPVTGSQQLPAANTRSTAGGETTAPEFSPKAGVPATFQVSDIRFLAYETAGQEPGKPTSEAALAANLSVSFTVRNNNASLPGSQIYLVIKSPSGQPVIDDEWVSGVFNTVREGNLRYSRSFRFDYNRNEAKRLSASMNLARNEAGTYTLFLYHNGMRIGKADLVLR